MFGVILMKPRKTEIKFNKVGPPEISSIISKLEVTKATGFDLISSRAIKENCAIILPTLVELANLTTRCTVFPDKLTIARVLLLYKKRL